MSKKDQRITGILCVRGAPLEGVQNRTVPGSEPIDEFNSVNMLESL